MLEHQRWSRRDPGGEVGKSTTWTCYHVLTSADIEPASHENNATVTGTYEETKTTHTSNTVIANAKAEQGFLIEKKQQLEGAGGFVTTKLTGKVGQTVEYEIVVSNTGNVPLTFSTSPAPWRCSAKNMASRFGW